MIESISQRLKTREGGICHLMGFEREKVGTTRTVDIENNTYLCYRINLGDNIG